MIVITGAAGFIGSCMTQKLNNMGMENLILVDDFSKEAKISNWINKKYVDKIDRKDFFKWADQNADKIDFIFHLGARTDTTEFNYSIFEELNIDYSQRMWSLATKYGIPLIYASSAATYGSGVLGYSDDHSLIHKLEPLNPYGKSKNEFDKWVLKQTKAPPFWAGFKFFNVFGPNEYHKGRMASVVYHAYHQIKVTGNAKLFKSHHSDYRDGEQIRDFIYVKDVVNVLYWYMNYKPESGIYNLGTGYARPFIALAMATFKAMKQTPHIEFIDIPIDIRDKYQYFTQAEMQKARKIGLKRAFRPLELSIKDYVIQYLDKNRTF
ncbi:MAG: ADP-glyceromanno-heptose 6-epimerase [Bacteroidales bacterium]|jgi:ADP-L-glycero-D-manno-heptose 6-epimerase|nr:ADP-glyceromanno-heptose 6-epimerase [Bacteroidales bacterium]